MAFQCILGEKLALLLLFVCSVYASGYDSCPHSDIDVASAAATCYAVT